MRTKNIISILFIFFIYSGKTQEFRDANVVAVITLGAHHYSIINETGTDNYFKTSPHEIGELSQDQNVELKFHPNNQNQAKVIASSLKSNLFCHLIGSNSPINEFVDVLELMPTLENEILFFEDRAHIDAFYDEVTLLFARSDKEMDVLLDIIEDQFDGFTSYRTWFNQEYNWLDGAFTKEDIDRISNLDFINDEIQKTMLNQEMLVGLSDSIYYFHSANVQIAIQKDNSRLLNILKDLTPDYDIFEPSSFLVVFQTEAKLISGLNSISPPKGEAVITDDLYYETTVSTSSPDECDTYTHKVRVYLYEFFTDVDDDQIVTLMPQQGTVSLTIDWNDGSNPQVVDNYISQWVSHTYPEEGVYNPTTSITFEDKNGGTNTIEDGNGTDGQEFQLLVKDGCTSNDAEKPGDVIDGDWGMGTKVWVSNNILGNHVGSYTHAWKKNNDGMWERHKADIYTSVHGVFRDFTDCDVQVTKDGQDIANLKKKVQTTKHKFFDYYKYKFGDADVSSHHYMIKGVLILEKDLVLNPC